MTNVVDLGYSHFVCSCGHIQTMPKTHSLIRQEPPFHPIGSASRILKYQMVSSKKMSELVKSSGKEMKIGDIFQNEEDGAWYVWSGTLNNPPPIHLSTTQLSRLQEHIQINPDNPFPGFSDEAIVKEIPEGGGVHYEVICSDCGNMLLHRHVSLAAQTNCDKCVSVMKVKKPYIIGT